MPTRGNTRRVALSAPQSERPWREPQNARVFSFTASVKFAFCEVPAKPDGGAGADLAAVRRGGGATAGQLRCSINPCRSVSVLQVHLAATPAPMLLQTLACHGGICAARQRGSCTTLHNVRFESFRAASDREIMKPQLDSAIWRSRQGASPTTGWSLTTRGASKLQPKPLNFTQKKHS